MQLLVHIFETESLSFAQRDVTGLDVKSAIAERYGCFPGALNLSLDGTCVNNCDFIPDEFGVVIRCVISVSGGKGGYGAMLRHLAKQSGAKKTTDFGACRDLSGRRLRHVNDEIVLQKWKEARENGKEMDTEEITQTGIDLWFLPAPSWIDGFKKPDPRKKFMKGRKKTRICLDWERARKDGRVPKNAPPWWGCPRGSRCEYAHGEAELPKEMIQELHEKRKQEHREKANEKRLSYVSAAEGAGHSDAEMSQMVLAGLQAAKRMKKEEAEKSAVPADDVLPLYSDSDIALTPSVNSRNTEQALEAASSSSHTATAQLADEGAVSAPPSPSAVSCTWMKVLSGTQNKGTYVPPLIDMNGLIEGYGEDSLASVAVMGCSLAEGQWYFEVEALTEGLIQIGLGDDSISVSAESGDGVGDDAHSWAFDAARSCVWHNGKDRAFGSGKWSIGDIVGVYVSIDAVKPAPDESRKRGRGKASVEKQAEHRELSIGFSLNGSYLGDGFVGQHCAENPSQYYFPVISVESGESARLNIGQRPFRFYQDGVALARAIDTAASTPTFSPVITSLDFDVTSSITEYMAFYSSIEQSSEGDSLINRDAISEVNAEQMKSPDAGLEEVGTKEMEEIHFEAIDIDSNEFGKSAEAFHRFGLVHLKAELERRGLKSGGTLLERADRLFAVRGVPPEKIDKKYRSKSGCK